MHRTRHRAAAAAAALALAAALTACAADSEPAGTAHNHADTEFAQMMIVHHEGAVEMADLAVERATDPEVRELAEQIEAAQDPEIALMTGWLETWGEEPEPMDHGGMDHGGMQMDGMDQEAAMGDLDALEGAEFDERFLELMTAHHEGAVEMAEQELEDGENPEALELAQTIVDDQTAEIAEMRELLDAS